MSRGNSGDRSTILLLNEGFNRAAWHGPNLIGSLRGLTLEALLYRPRSAGHNIWELAVHCAYWKYAVRNRVVSGKRNTFPLEGSNFFRRDPGLNLTQWKRDLALLKQEHEALMATIRALDPRTLDRRIKGTKHTLRRLALGIAAHDIYHSGQISLLKRMAASLSPPPPDTI